MDSVLFGNTFALITDNNKCFLDVEETIAQNSESKQMRIDTIPQGDRQQIPPAPVSTEKTMVSKTLPAAAPDLCF
jgi:hypothetical protein